MQALILAGGEGTRLRPLTLNTPKPVVPIANEPFLLRQIQSLKAAGITDIILSLNYLPSAIENILGNGAACGVTLNYIIEPEPMGTAGAYKFAEHLLKSTALVLNGDILTDIDLAAVIRHHQKYDAAATIVLTEVENPSAYGLVRCGDNHEVLGFLEKPKLEDIKRLNINTVNAGIYILEPRILNLMSPGKNYSFEYQLFPDLLAKKENFRAYVANENYWIDIGTPEKYLQANQDLINGKIRDFFLKKDTDIHRATSAEIDSLSYLGNGCVIKPGSKILNSIIGENVLVEENVIIENSVIWKDTVVNSSVKISDSILGYNCRIGKNAQIRNGSILGDNTTITDFSRY